MTELQREAKRLHGIRASATTAEASLLQAIQRATREHGSARRLAARCGVSAAYLSDVRHGNRGIGGGLLAKLCEGGE